ncbi:MAG: hypothetical protein DCE92_01935 [Alphaproteobacteria bacterium]|nr:MAG: hypothetical protein DCE92_01935 [Alphaproteobacteria bacterium]
MSLNLLTDPNAVHAAMDEFDALGSEAFLAKYGYGRARSLFIAREGSLYDSKAIAGVAFGIQFPDRGPLKPEEFSGGEATVRPRLEALGFTLWSNPGVSEPFDAGSALEAITSAWGAPRRTTKYIAAWATPHGRELALQLGQERAKTWIEEDPAGVGLHAVHYAYNKSRNSNLSSTAPRLALPHPAWVVELETQDELQRLLAWYAELAITPLNAEAFERLKVAFKREMPGFVTFNDPGDPYVSLERAPKDELVERFARDVAPHLSETLTDEGATALTAAYHTLLSQKQEVSGSPQNMVSWQAVDRINPKDATRSIAIGRALNQLLWLSDETPMAAADDMFARLDVFIETLGEEFRQMGASGATGVARLLGTAALMFHSPDAFVAVRTDLFERALQSLKGEKFPSYADEPSRVRSAIGLCEAVREALVEAGWEPRDQIDVQSFLWVALMYDAPAVSGTRFAELTTAFLNRFSEVRETPFKTTPDLWATMNDLKVVLEADPTIAARGTLHVEWSLGKGVWATVPWIAVMDDRLTTSTQRGVYVVFLVARDLSSIHLTLMQGTTDVVGEQGQTAGLTELRARADAYRAQIPELVDVGFRLDGDIVLGAEGWRAKSYEAATIAHLPIPVGELPSDEELETYLSPLLAAYERIVTSGPLDTSVIDGPEAPPPLARYTIEEAMTGLFMDRAEFERILAIWKDKKNLVLQGAPGVGKSFIARRLGYALMAQKDPERVAVVQFHQSYGYEDFIQGYRPTSSGGFQLRDGVFYRFCQQAKADPSRPHVFIIDEINRGNLSKVFGELMLLIEHDKRAAEWAASLAYADEKDPPFYVPENVYLLGMMNTADRSLSVVDYALRRRFAFVTLRPGFTQPAFGQHLRARGASAGLIAGVVQGMQELNAAIADDRVNLGPGFQIGHSFFTPSDSQTPDKAWFQRVVETEIRPLLEEYWFDAPDRAEDWCGRLLSHA